MYMGLGEEPLPHGLVWDESRCFFSETSHAIVVEGQKRCEECTVEHLEELGTIVLEGGLPEDEYDPGDVEPEVADLENVRRRS